MHTMPAPDVSVVFNIHRESPYIRRTVSSLNEAAAHAAAASIRCELIVVFDRSDALTMDVTRGAQADAFASIRYIEVDHGSLGLARNSGIAVAEGEYVWLADADDLVSYNSLSAMHAVAKEDPDAVVFPEYLIAFGEACWVARYYDDSVVTTADFVYGHPYISRIFLRRQRLEGMVFHDLRLSSGFAYEDWHFNCELRARGMRFRVASQTLFFYRQRKGSLLRQANAVSVGQIPHSALFAPETFSMHVIQEESDPSRGEREARRDAARSADPVAGVMSDRVCRDLMAAANRIDPGVNLYLIRHTGNAWTNVFPNQHWGHDYAHACAIVGGQRFTDIVFLPCLGAGGGEKYILDVLHALASGDPSFRCLVISGEAAQGHAWLDRLPPNATFLDVFNVFPWLGEHERDLLVLRLVTAVVGDGTRLHLKDSHFAKRWFGKFSNAIGHLAKPIYYRFSDERVPFDDGFVELGWCFDFLSTEIPNIGSVISDHERIVEDDRRRIGVHGHKWHCLYAAHAAGEVVRRGGPVFRLLWASRLSPSKRPELLPRIVQAVRQVLPQVRFAAAGVAEGGEDWVQAFRATDGLEYLGPFDTFEALGPQGYDALVYTSAFDGLPNVVLEAMGHGLPVIAPDVGGVREAVESGRTGWLIPQQTGDDALVQAYVDAVVALYQDWSGACALGAAGRELVARRHSSENHRRDVGRIFLGIGAEG